MLTRSPATPRPRHPQDKAQVLSDVRSIIAEQLGTDLDKVRRSAAAAVCGRALACEASRAPSLLASLAVLMPAAADWQRRCGQGATAAAARISAAQSAQSGRRRGSWRLRQPVKPWPRQPRTPKPQARGRSTACRGWQLPRRTPGSAAAALLPAGASAPMHQRSARPILHRQRPVGSCCGSRAPPGVLRAPLPLGPRAQRSTQARLTYPRCLLAGCCRRWWPRASLWTWVPTPWTPWRS